LPDLFGISRWKEEIEAWQSYAKALPAEDREIFRKIVEGASQYEDGLENSVKGRDTEAFLLSILLSQQKKIQELKEFIAARKSKKEEKS
jgi:hypothetical protein